MSPVELRASYPDLASLTSELESNLVHGRAFLAEATEAPVLSECVLVLVHPEHGTELRLSAIIVMVSTGGAMVGTGIELRPFGAAIVEQMRAFLTAPPPAAEPAHAVASQPHAQHEAHQEHEAQTQATPDDAAALDIEGAAAAAGEGVSSNAAGADRGESAAEQTADGLADPADASLLPEGEDEDDAQLERGLATGQSVPPDVQLESKQEKLRHLNAAEQLKVARTGELADRITVERLYGKQVWDALLRNPRLTVPEVARIARKGTVPKPLIEVILENAAWIKTPQVRRALLGNPKLSTDAINKLLRGTPKHELKLIEKGTAYAMPVREAARKLLKQ